MVPSAKKPITLANTSCRASSLGRFSSHCRTEQKYAAQALIHATTPPCSSSRHLDTDMLLIAIPTLQANAARELKLRTWMTRSC